MDAFGKGRGFIFKGRHEFPNPKIRDVPRIDGGASNADSCIGDITRDRATIGRLSRSTSGYMHSILIYSARYDFDGGLLPPCNNMTIRLPLSSYLLFGACDIGQSPDPIVAGVSVLALIAALPQYAEDTPKCPSAHAKTTSTFSNGVPISNTKSTILTGNIKTTLPLSACVVERHWGKRKTEWLERSTCLLQLWQLRKGHGRIWLGLSLASDLQDLCVGRREGGQEVLESQT